MLSPPRHRPALGDQSQTGNDTMSLPANAFLLV
jgi:hypothetical protein